MKQAQQRSFIITGCARSGTAYTAKLLTAAGVPCTHEEVFSLHAAERLTAGHAGGVHSATFKNVGEELGRKGESSWLAAPLLDKLPKDIIIFHQLRNPLHVIRSLMRRRFFHQDRGTGSDYAKYARRWMEQEQLVPPSWNNNLMVKKDPLLMVRAGNNIETHDPPIVQCMKYWVRWNQLVFKNGTLKEFTVGGALAYRVEDLSANQLVFPTMLKMITGSWVPPSTDFFDRVPVGVNHVSVNMDSEVDNISWDDLPEVPVKRTLEQMASAWGYRTGDLV